MGLNPRTNVLFSVQTQVTSALRVLCSPEVSPFHNSLSHIFSRTIPVRRVPKGLGILWNHFPVLVKYSKIWGENGQKVC